MDSNIATFWPKVFISYAHLPAENLEWARMLGDKIKAAGIPVTTDRDKDPDQEMASFVVSIVNDVSYTHILIICTQTYAEMADSRGVGVEMKGPIITDRLFAINENKRFIPIVRELNDQSLPCLPKYLANRPTVYFTNDAEFEANCQALIARIKRNDEKGTLNRAPDGSTLRIPRADYKYSGRSVAWTVVAILLVVIRIALRCSRDSHSSYNYNGNINSVGMSPLQNRTGWTLIGDKYALMKKDGTVNTDALYDKVHPFLGQKAGAKKNGKWGFVDIYGNEITPFVYNEVAFVFYDNCCRVKKDDKWGYINNDGTEFIPCTYDAIGSFSQNRVAVKEGNKWGYVNAENKLIIPYKYDMVKTFNNDKAEVYQNGKRKYIDLEGNETDAPASSSNTLGE